MSLNKPTWLLLGFILIFGITYFSTYYPSANDLPRGIHQWAQADRLALCYRFADGKPLTHPATFNLKTTDGDVGVELSLFQYILAQSIKLGYPRHSLPFLYKIFTFSFFFLALSLLSSSLLHKEKILTQLFLFITIVSSPVLIYYGYNYLPDVWALSLVLFSLYFFHKDTSKYIFIILIISGLGLFTKATSGIYFIAIYSVYFLQNVRKLNVRFWLASVLFAAIIAFVTYYNIHYVIEVNKRIWSTVFMSRIIPLSSFNEFWEVLDTSWRFKNDYLTTTQRLVFIPIIIGGFWSLAKSSCKSKYVQLYALLLLGFVSIIVLFGPQFINHDYYVLCTIVPAFIFGILLVSKRFLPYIHPTTAAIILGIVALFSYSQANSRYFERMSEVVHIKGYPEKYAYKWLLGAEEKIAKWVSTDEHVYVCYVPEPNHSLIYLNRKGANFNTEEMGRYESPFWYYLDRIKPKCIIVQTENIANLKKDQPRVAEIADKVYSDEQLTIFKLKD